MLKVLICAQVLTCSRGLFEDILKAKMSSPLKQDGDDDEDAMQCLLDTIIGEDYIVQQTGITDFSKIIHLQLSIDTSQQSIFELSDLLPNLQHLELDNSTIASVRDLGIGLRRITSLSLATCGLNDLDGIGVLTGLQELNLSNNYITDVTPLAIHENLQVRRFRTIYRCVNPTRHACTLQVR